MQRHLLFFASAITLGALSGFLVTNLPKHAESRALTQVSAKSASAASAARLRGAPEATAFSRMIAASTVAIDHARGRNPATSIGLLLKEPVFVMHSGGEPQVNFPTGTEVALVKNEGRFLRVRHEQTVVTIPRSAVVAGVSRTN